MGEIGRPIVARWRMRALIFALLAAAALSTAPDRAAAEHQGDPSDRAEASIVGGKAASIASYPWLAHISYRGSIDSFGCAGTVVSPRLVLTAAHCALTGTGKLAVASSFSVLTGVGDLREATPERASRVSQVLIFPGYDPARVLNDAALLVLASPVSAPALPLATPSDLALLAKGVPVAVAGWGLIDVEPRQLPAAVREAESVVQSTAFCQRVFRRVLSSYVPASQICVKSPPGSGVSLCDGDSGGPAIARRPDGAPVQIGIISLKGSLDCDPRTPQVLARVDRVVAWVDAWKAAIESGGPAPPVVVPKVELPPVTRLDAEFIAWLGLEADFGNRFAKGRLHGIGCKRINREKVKCQVEWVHGNDYYRGGITIYAALPREGFIYNYRYKIRRFNLRCWLTYVHPIQACNPKLFRR